MNLYKHYYANIVIILTTALAIFLMQGCSSSTEPDNLEPILEITAVSDITRNEASVEARVLYRGQGQLSYLTLHYGKDENYEHEIRVSDPDNEYHKIELTSLTPGCSYSCYLTGGTSTARLKSEKFSFTTISNDKPSVSDATLLSTGPIGVILSFNITDDGGEPLTAAGCELSVPATGNTKRFELKPEELSRGTHRLSIGGLEPENTYVLKAYASNTIGETLSDPLEFTTLNGIILTEPGSLAALFSGSAAVTLTNLSIAGEMNGDDFRVLRMLLGAPADDPLPSDVRIVDLTDVTIVSGGAPYDGSRYTQDNIITTGLLADCLQLSEVELPATATRVERDAFARCTALEQITLSAGVESFMPSDGCTALCEIIVSPANTRFSAHEGVLFNYSGDEILWFPLGKTGNFTLPETITSIGENAFMGTHITGLEIPESVKQISRGAFAGSALESITMPDKLTNISEALFQNCKSLLTVKLGSGTQYIGDYAFDGTSLHDLYVYATTPPFVASQGFTNRLLPMPGNCTLHVPAGKKAIYRNHRQWGTFSKIVED